MHVKKIPFPFTFHHPLTFSPSYLKYPSPQTEPIHLMALQDQIFPDNLVLENRNFQSLVMNNNGYDLISPANAAAAAFQLEKQGQEFDDQFIISQRKRLKWKMDRQWMESVKIMLRECEAKAVFMANQKDKELARVKRKQTELQDLFRKIVMECEGWKVTAMQNEAMAVSINNSIAEVMEKASKTMNNDLGIEVADSESRCQEEGKVGGINGMICKTCELWYACMVFFPCQHLCSCQSCEPLMSSCPICETGKECSLKVLV